MINRNQGTFEMIQWDPIYPSGGRFLLLKACCELI